MPHIMYTFHRMNLFYVPCDPEIVSSANELITSVIKTLENHTRSQIEAEIWRSRFIKYFTSYVQNTCPIYLYTFIFIHIYFYRTAQLGIGPPHELSLCAPMT